MKLQHFWWLLVILVVIACGREGTSVETIIPPSNLTLEQVGNDTILVSWDFNISQLDTSDVNLFVIERVIGAYNEEDNPWIKIATIPVEVSDTREDVIITTVFADTNLVILDDFSYRVQANVDDTPTEWISETLSLKEISFFSFSHEGILILAPGETEKLEIDLLHNDAVNSDTTLVEIDYEVNLSFKSVPHGTNINNALHDTTSVLKVNSKNGVIPITLNAGQNSGIVSIEATTSKYTDGTKVTSILPDILIQAPPASAKLMVAGANSAQQEGIFWSLEAAAYVVDTNNQPVIDGVGVTFTLLDNQDIVSINESGLIGNINADGDSIPGYAFTNLKYFGIHTNKTVTIKAECQDAVDTLSFVLPVQYPDLDLIVEPEQIVWEANDHEPKEFNLEFKLLDALNYPILNQKLLFNAELGTSLAGNNPDSLYTSNDPDNYGMGEITWVYNEDDCPEPVDEASVLETEIVITLPADDPEDPDADPLMEYSVPVTLIRNP